MHVECLTLSHSISLHVIAGTHLGVKTVHKGKVPCPELFMWTDRAHAGRALSVIKLSCGRANLKVKEKGTENVLSIYVWTCFHSYTDAMDPRSGWCKCLRPNVLVHAGTGCPLLVDHHDQPVSPFSLARNWKPLSNPSHAWSHTSLSTK